PGLAVNLVTGIPAPDLIADGLDVVIRVGALQDSSLFSRRLGALKSGPLTANWFNQPLNLDFSTTEGAKAYQVAVNLNGNWQP
ncbi:hypothetical protein KU406_24275, partial [Salmonella enterica subsp. enterica serovar Montevideo]|nr:hypothetical protein [Salmonella enterica subsp. enterica serovar Montevideo]